MNKIFGTIILALLFNGSSLAEEHQKIGNGFSFYKKDFDLGSKGVLIVEKTVPSRMLNPGVGRYKFGVDLQNVEANLDALSKFVDLATQANQNHETLTKSISTVKAFGFGLYDYWNQYDVVTQADESATLSNVLRITPVTKVVFKTVPTAVDPANARDLAVSVHYNLEDAKELINLLTIYKNGKIDESIAKTAAETGLLQKVEALVKGKTTKDEAKKLLGEPSQEMETQSFDRMDYAELNGKGKNVMVVLMFDKLGKLKECMITRW